MNVKYSQPRVFDLLKWGRSTTEDISLSFDSSRFFTKKRPEPCDSGDHKNCDRDHSCEHSLPHAEREAITAHLSKVGLMDLLSAMLSFIRVAETGSFSVASRELHVSQPTISRQILLLEKHYSVRLFSRTTRCLALTDDGRMLLEQARNVHSILENTHSTLSGRQSRVYGHIRVGTPTAFGLYLTQQLDGFLNQHPDLSVELVVSDTFGDIVKDGIDLAIRVGMCQSGTTITRHLADVDRVLVASPDFFENHSYPAHPNDLLNLPLVVYGYGFQEAVWEFQRGNQQIRLPMHSSFTTNNSEVAHRAIVEGIGIGLMPLFSVRRELRLGNLVHLMSQWTVPKLDLHVVYPGPQNSCLRRKTVLDFLLSLAPDLAETIAPTKARALIGTESLNFMSLN